MQKTPENSVENEPLTDAILKYFTEPGWNTWTNPNVQQSTPPFRQPLLPDPTNTSSKNSSIRLWKVVPDSDADQSGSTDKLKPVIENFPTPLDAAKRKTLPAWIR